MWLLRKRNGKYMFNNIVQFSWLTDKEGRSSNCSVLSQSQSHCFRAKDVRYNMCKYIILSKQAKNWMVVVSKFDTNFAVNIHHVIIRFCFKNPQTNLYLLNALRTCIFLRHSLKPQKQHSLSKILLTEMTNFYQLFMRKSLLSGSK